MKQHLLIPVSAILLCGTAMAQQSKVLAPIKNKAVANKAVKVSLHQSDLNVGGANEKITPSAGNQMRSIAITNLGTSTYQLQTNNAIQNRITKNSDGTISAVFTYSATGTWSERGTGYVYHNGTSWSAAPTARIESVRTGWPSLFVLGDNSEGVITHATAPAPGNLCMTKRPTKGTGAFTDNTTIVASTAAYGDYWPRACAGGVGNNSIHLISISNPTDGAATPAPVFYNGQQGCITYSRSLDGGATWDKLHQVQTAHDSTQYYGFNADSYAIDARGNVIAYVVGGDYNDLFIMKSLDNGTTWTKTIIQSFPIPFFNDELTDVPPTDGIADTITTNDGNVAILIDNNDDVHVWFGRMRVIDDVVGDGASSYFPGTDGLMYWNENMGASAPVTIAGMEDTDGDLAISVTDWGTYYASLTSQPSAGIDAAGTIHLTYASLVEYTDFGDGKSFRNLYYMSSSDGGATWTPAIRMSSDDFTEQVFCSVARNADPTCVSMIFQTDIAPGTGVTSASVDYANNTGVIDDQWYACLNPMVGVLETTNLTEQISMFPNPSSTNVSVSALTTIENINVYNTLGSVVLSVAPNSNATTLDIANLTNGIYMVSIKTAGRTISKPLIKE
jgi:Secretion system C-terminal sorting domain